MLFTAPQITALRVQVPGTTIVVDYVPNMLDTCSACTNPEHDHTTNIDRHGMETDEPIRLLCAHDDRPAHYDYTVEMYAHDDPAAPACFLIPFYAGTPCTFAG
jgi:hypothetical protein